jgi:prophage maintenance system killer protein
VEGNKRVALILVDAFVRLNGYVLQVRTGELAEQILQAAVADSKERDEAIERATVWFRSKLIRLEEEA